MYHSWFYFRRFDQLHQLPPSQPAAGPAPVAQELDQRFAFRELAHLLPGLTLRLAFVGHEIAPQCHRRSYGCGADRVTVVAYSGLWPGRDGAAVTRPPLAGHPQQHLFHATPSAFKVWCESVNPP